MTSCLDRAKTNPVASQLAHISSVAYKDPMAARGLTELESFSANHTTHRSGIYVKPFKGVDHIMVVLSEIPGVDRRIYIDSKKVAYNSILGLAKVTDNSDLQVMTDTIIDNAGEALIQILYRQSSEYIDSFPGVSTARRYLKQIAHKKNHRPAHQTVHLPGYMFWRFPQFSTLVLPPPTDEFRCKVKSYRLEGQKIQFRSCKKTLMQATTNLVEQTKKVKDELDKYSREVKPYAQDIAVLSATRNVMDLMINHPEGRQAQMSPKILSLRQKISDLEEYANQDFLHNPVDGSILKYYKDDVFNEAKKLRELLQQAEVIEAINVFKKYRYLWTSTVFDEYCYAEAAAFALLMQTPQSNYITKHWMQRIINIIDQDSEAQNLAETSVEPLSTCEATLRGAAFVPMSLGNMPGPPSLMVAIVQAFTPHFIGQAVADPSKATGFFQISMRTVLRAGGLTPTQYKDLQALVKRKPQPHWTTAQKNQFNQNTQQKIKDLVHGNFQSQIGWTMIMGIINGAILLYYVKNNEIDTVNEWLNVSSMLFGTLSPLIQLLQAVRFFKQFQLLTVGGQAFGIAAGIFAAIASFEAAYSAYKIGDNTGAAISAVLGVSAGMTVAVYLIGSGATLELGGVTIPLGMLLIIAGILVGIITTIVAYIVDGNTAFSYKQFEGFFTYLQDYKQSKQFWYALTQPEYTRISRLFYEIYNNRGIYKSDFKDLSPTTARLLHDTIFQDWDIAANLVGFDSKDELFEEYPALKQPTAL